MARFKRFRAAFSRGRSRFSGYAGRLRGYGSRARRRVSSATPQILRGKVMGIKKTWILMALVGAFFFIPKFKEMVNGWIEGAKKMMKGKPA